GVVEAVHELVGVAVDRAVLDEDLADQALARGDGTGHSEDGRHKGTSPRMVRREAGPTSGGTRARLAALPRGAGKLRLGRAREAGEMDEVEIKFRLAGDAEQERIRAALRGLGAQRRGVEREENVLFDDPARTLRARGIVLRLRVLDGGPRAKLTFKGPARF